jgi:hypothetical protein
MLLLSDILNDISLILLTEFDSFGGCKLYELYLLIALPLGRLINQNILVPEGKEVYFKATY